MVSNIVMKYYSDMVTELGKTVSNNGDLSNDEIRQLMEKTGLTLNQLIFRLASSKADLFIKLQQTEAENQRLKETCRRQSRALEKYAEESKLSKSAAEVRNVMDATCISCVMPVDATLVISQYEDDQLQLMCTLEEFEQFGAEEATAR